MVGRVRLFAHIALCSQIFEYTTVQHAENSILLMYGQSQVVIDRRENDARLTYRDGGRREERWIIFKPKRGDLTLNCPNVSTSPLDLNVHKMQSQRPSHERRKEISCTIDVHSYVRMHWIWSQKKCLPPQVGEFILVAVITI